MSPAGSRYDVVLVGQLRPGLDVQQVHRRLAIRFKREPAFIEWLLGRGPIAIKKNVARDIAERYCKAVRADGALCEIVDHGAAVTEVTAESAPPTAADDADHRRRQERLRQARERELKRQREAERQRSASPPAASPPAPSREPSSRKAPAPSQPASAAPPARTPPRPAKREVPAQVREKVAPAREPSERAGREDLTERVEIQAAPPPDMPPAQPPAKAPEPVAEAATTAVADATDSAGAGADVDSAAARDAEREGEPELVAAAANLVSGRSTPVRPESAGGAFDLTVMRCGTCGYALKSTARECPRCAARVRAPAQRNRRLVTLAVAAAVAVAAALVVIFGYPRYQQQQLREQVMAAAEFVVARQAEVSAQIKQRGRYPSSNVEAGLAPDVAGGVIASLSLGNNAVMTVTYRKLQADSGPWQQEFWPVEVAGDLLWVCARDTLPVAFRNAECSNVNVDEILRTAEKTLLSADEDAGLRVPRSWQRLAELEDVALLGVGDPVDEIYVMVTATPASELEDVASLDDYARAISVQLQENVDNGAWLQTLTDITIGADLPAKRGVLRAVIDQLESTYLVTLVRSADVYYQVLGWTLSDQYGQHEALLQKISGSLRLNPASAGEARRTTQARPIS